MKGLLLLTVVVSLIGWVSAEDEQGQLDDAYGYQGTSIDGETVDFEQYRGKALLIVNVASHCGATDQYVGLQALSTHFAKHGLVVMAFPTNDFGEQEPGTDAEIKAFCTDNYRVSFPMFSKSPVKGEKQCDLFRYLTTAENPDHVGDVRWNFEKFLVGKDGKLKRRFSTSVEPVDTELVDAIEDELAEGE